MPPFTYKNVLTATTTTIKGSELYKLQFNAASASPVTIYDSATASGTLIGTIPTAAAAASYVYEAALTTGSVTIVTGATTDVTILTK